MTALLLDLDQTLVDLQSVTDYAAARRDAGRVWLPMLLVPAACDTDAYRNEAGKRGDVIMLVSTIVYELPEPALNPRHFVERKQGHTAGCPIGCLPSIQFRP